VTAASWLQLGALVALLVASCPFVGAYLAKVYGGADAPGDRVFLPVERGVYKLSGVDERKEQRWTVYAFSLLAFGAASVLLLYVLQRVQGSLPINPKGFGGVSPAVSFNAAVSFITNTNWQSYSGESTMSHLTQMLGLAVQNFVSAAVGLAVAVALIRGLVRRRSDTIGNFWVDVTRSISRVLLPLAFVFALVFVGQGMVQNTKGDTTVAAVEQPTPAADGKTPSYVVPGGPVASQESIKELGTNGGGFYNANSAHPFENPNGLTNFLQLYLILLLPFSLPFTFGKMARDPKQGLVVLGAMAMLWITSVLIASGFETAGNPRLTAAGANQTATATQAGGNAEGKEVRFGPAASGLYAASTTGTSTGAVIAAHDSFTPIGGMVPLANIMLGEVSPGGVGSGLYGMLVFALLSVFIAGLMVGRTPEYLGKKIQAADVKLVALYLLAVPLVVLAFAGASMFVGSAIAGQGNSGPHGLSEIVYAFASSANNNGSAFGGLTVTSDWYQVTLGLSMLTGRFLLMVAALAIAGGLARKQPSPPTAGTFPTGTPLFAALLTGIVVIVVGLTYFPALALGPIVEHLSL